MAKRRRKKATKRRKKTTKRKTKGRSTKRRKATKRKTKGRSTKRRKATKRKTKGRSTKRRRTAKKKTRGKKKRKPNAAFMAPLQPSAALAEVVGSKPLPRTQVVKKIWQYIKRRNLQDPKNRRNIVADAKLLKIFKGKKVVSMFQMTKILSKQLKAA